MRRRKPDPLLGADEAARLLDVTKAKFEALCRGGKIPVAFTIKRRWHIKKSDLLRYAPVIRADLFQSERSAPPSAVAPKLAPSVERPLDRFETDLPLKGAKEVLGNGDLDSWAYFIQRSDGGSIKIGESNNPPDRLDGLQTAHDVELKLIIAVRGGAPFEKYFHSLFKEYHVRGEWFRSEEPLLNAIDLLAQHVDLSDIHPTSQHPIYCERRVDADEGLGRLPISQHHADTNIADEDVPQWTFPWERGEVIHDSVIVRSDKDKPATDADVSLTHEPQ